MKAVLAILSFILLFAAGATLASRSVLPIRGQNPVDQEPSVVPDQSGEFKRKSDIQTPGGEVYGTDSFSTAKLMALEKLPINVVLLSPVLEKLHGTVVKSFETAPKFGNGRNQLNRFKPPHSRLPGGSTQPRTHDLNHVVKRMDYYTAFEEHWMWLEEMRGLTKNGFVYQVAGSKDKQQVRPENEQGNGFVTALLSEEENSLDSPHDVKAFLRRITTSPLVRTLEKSEQLWDLSQFQLISVLMNSPPEVYLHSISLELDFVTHNPGSAFPPTRHPSPTRPMDDMESTGLQFVRNGYDCAIGWDSGSEEIQMVGAIRAKEKCLYCHVAAVGDTLGAFSYRIKRISHSFEPIGDQFVE